MKSVLPLNKSALSTFHSPVIDVAGINEAPWIFAFFDEDLRKHELLQKAVTMSLDADGAHARIIITATILHEQTGYHVPADPHLRQMIPPITTTDQQRELLPLLEVPTIPDDASTTAACREHSAPQFWRNGGPTSTSIRLLEPDTDRERQPPGGIRCGCDHVCFCHSGRGSGENRGVGSLSPRIQTINGSEGVKRAGYHYGAAGYEHSLQQGYPASINE